jgi:hypothetical protein
MAQLSTTPKPRSLLPEPALGWLAIFALIALTALCTLAGIGTPIRFGFPLLSFLVGILLYCRYPLLYLGFTWWIWLLTPWVRRLIDYQSGWVNPSPVLLAPYLVTLIMLVKVLRQLPKMWRQDSLPYVFALFGATYALFVGLVNTRFATTPKVAFLHSIMKGVTTNTSDSFSYTPTEVIVSALDWSAPILFGCYLFLNWRQFPQYQQNFRRTFNWGVLVVGSYGVIQYLIAPEWDRFWLKNAIEAGGTSFGTPEPLGIRIFSTLNAPGPFAGFMMAGLLLLLSGGSNLRFLAMVPGYLSFLLSLVRIMWGSWLLGLLIFSSSLKQQVQMRLIVSLMVISIIAVPLTTVEPFAGAISSRFQTLSNVQNDGSFQARSMIYENAIGAALLDIPGNGFGSPRMDSAFIDIFVSMGWIGAIPYFGGLLLLVTKQLQCLTQRLDPFIGAANAISLVMFIALPIGNPLIEISGVILWSFQGLALAGQKYYQHQSRKMV